MYLLSWLLTAVTCATFRLPLSRLVQVLDKGSGATSDIDGKQEPDPSTIYCIKTLVLVFCGYHYVLYFWVVSGITRTMMIMTAI